ncbi:MAG: 16S rRNA (cytidine(1402)-2'-O)-methyltransferase [Verrucomicrobiota bacterium]|nr:16S rRNA (cytidine(1402)-2'-O)-methyltransferase [Verrucomicrobiota bacterium]
MLFFVATPIGNLDDLSKRAIDTLKTVDLIFCEDTRHSQCLLRHYDIHRPLSSYHRFNEKKREEEILLLLKEGKRIALLSDAGTPCLSDPGALLAQACIREKIPFTALPGPCSPIQALLLSGFAGEKFQYIGFFPRKGNKERLQALAYPGVTIAGESPHRLIATLQWITEKDPERPVAVAREMTKTFEKCVRGTSREVLLHFTKEEPRGEMMLCIGPGVLPSEELSAGECALMLCKYHGLSLKEAIREAALLLNKSKRDVYTEVHLES